MLSLIFQLFRFRPGMGELSQTDNELKQFLKGRGNRFRCYERNFPGRLLAQEWQCGRAE